jgi:hypothetical protein
MQSIIVYIDNADWALRQLAPMACSEGAVPLRCVLVACPPRLSQRIGKWTSHAARESWRERWSGELFRRVEPMLLKRGHCVVRVVAKTPLTTLTTQLVREHAAVHVLDARRPKFGETLPPVTPEQAAQLAQSPQGRWEIPAAVIGLGAALTLAAE